MAILSPRGRRKQDALKAKRRYGIGRWRARKKPTEGRHEPPVRKVEEEPVEPEEAPTEPDEPTSAEEDAAKEPEKQSSGKKMRGGKKAAKSKGT